MPPVGMVRPARPATMLDGLCARAGRFTLGPLTLVLPGGSYTCVLGPSGAGKTLLLAAIAGGVPTGGQVRMGAVRLDVMAAGARGVALVGRAGAGGWAAWSVAAVLGRALHAVRAADRSRRAAALADEFGLALDARLGALGPNAALAMRVAVAVAAEPSLLLLDEPLADVDDRDQAVGMLLEAAARRELTVLHATRHRAEAFALAERLVLLEGGQVLQQGQAGAVYDRPDTLAIARRLAPATELQGTLVKVDNDVAAVRLSGGLMIEADPPAGPDGGAAWCGAACTVLLRPERIVVSALPVAALGEGAIAGLVRSITPGGDTLRLRVAIGTDTELLVARPAVLGARGLVVGGAVSVAWQSRHALTFLA